MSLHVCKDGLDPLADRGQVWPMSGLIAPCGSHDLGTQGIDRGGEGTPGIALVTHQNLAARSRTARQQLNAHLAFVAFGRGQCERTRGAVSARRSHAV